jgi:hypothetical protein
LLGSVVAAGLAFAAVLSLITPTVVPLQPSAAIPTFNSVQNEVSGGAKATSGDPALAASIRTDPAVLAGKSADDIGKIADQVCFRRAHAFYPHWNKTPRLTTKAVIEISFDDLKHFNELMHCLITEAPARYCSSSQRGMISAEINRYFVVIASLNRSVDRLRKAVPDIDFTFRETSQRGLPTAEADEPILVAIEMRLRDGYLTAADRERLTANAPPGTRVRLTRIALPPKSSCPVQPWWSFWR